MEFFEVVKKRRSIHYFTNEEVSDEDLNHILEAARWAPSAGNARAIFTLNKRITRMSKLISKCGIDCGTCPWNLAIAHARKACVR